MTLKHLRHPVLAAVAAIALTGLAGCHSDTSAADKDAIQASVQHWVAAVEARDIDGIMAYYVPDDSLFVYDVIPPRQYVGAAAYRKDWEETLAPYVGPIHISVADWTIDVEGNLAFAHGTSLLTGKDKDGKPMDINVRVTDVYKKIGGKWLVVHEHVSVPIDPITNKPDFASRM
jgi:ketosteroid isomerase-like protein